MKERAIDLQLIKPVSGKTNLKGKIKLKDLQKELLNDLNVPYADPCCVDENAPVPVRFVGDNIESYNPATGLWEVISVGSPAARFGFPGEDDIASEDRFFEINNFSVEFVNDSNYNNYVGIYPDSFDVYHQTPGGLGNDFAELYIQPGSVGIYLDDNSILEIDGIDTGEPTNGTLGLDSNNKVVRRIGDGSRYAELSNSANMPSGGLNPVAGLTLTNVQPGIYEVNLNLAINIFPDGSTGFNFQFAYSGNSGNQRQIYRALEWLTPNNEYVIGHLDALSFAVISPTGVLTTPSAEGSFTATGYIDIGTAGDLTVNIEALTAGTVIILPSSYINLRKMA